MKVDLGSLDPDAYPRKPGSFVIMDTKWGPRAQAWPRRGAKKVTRQEKWWRDQFGLAGRMAANPTDLELQTAIFLSKKLINPPRDLLTQAAYGKLYEIVAPDGTVWPTQNHGPPPAPTPPPPVEDEIMWEWAAWDNARTGTSSSTSYATKGLRIIPLQNMKVRGVRIGLSTVSATGTYRCTIASMVSGTTLNVILASQDKTGFVVNQFPLEFEVSADLVAGTSYAILCTRTDLTATSVLPVRFPSIGWLIPMDLSVISQAATLNPVSGQVMTAGSSSGMALGLKLVP